jgi:hypothetical protein
MNNSLSSIVSRASALFLAIMGLALLFASDNILPQLVQGSSPSLDLIGQLLGGAWLGVAALNWLSKSALIGGIYSRPVVSANVLLYFVTALSLIKPLMRGGLPGAVWILFVPIAGFAVVYLWLLFRGPSQRDLEKFNKSQVAR